MRRRPVNTAERPQKSADGRDLGGHGAKSAAVRERAILALLSERTIGQAAAKADVNERTLRRWASEDEAFQAEYAAARQAAFQVGMNRIQTLTALAVDTLEGGLDPISWTLSERRNDVHDGHTNREPATPPAV